ncbi:MAG TPA: ATP-binding protein, partial [Cyclobacteriaceae bacterium]|nr:ATP-binding protein [Cyclobacteriaceae bacterium]
MEFNWRSPHFTRLAILVVTVLVLGIIVGSDNRSYLAIAGLLIAIAFQISLLIKLIESNQNSYSVFSSIQFDDVLGSFKTTSSDLTALRFRDELNDAVTKLRISKKEKERDSEYQFFKNIVQHVGIGILTFKKDGSILLINSAAKRLLHVNKADTIDELREMSEPLVEAFLKLKTGGRELVLLKYGDDDVQLSIFAIELTLKGEVVKLISMNNIKTELEEKEMEAWQNLVRVLTHEIMNSVTPISSLAGVVEEELNQQLKGSTEVHLKKEAAEDMHLSLQTISRRSEGLIRFV